jgi:hypothetical protein
MAEFGLYSVNGGTIQKWQADSMLREGEFVHLLKAVPTNKEETVAIIRLNAGQNVSRVDTVK